MDLGSAIDWRGWGHRLIKEYVGAVPDRKMTIQRVIADGKAIATEYDFAGTSSGMHPALPPKGEAVRTTFCTENAENLAPAAGRGETIVRFGEVGQETTKPL